MPPQRRRVRHPQVDAVLLVNRITWGVSPSLMRHVDEIDVTRGVTRYLAQQLHPSAQTASALPAEIQAQLAALTITQRPLEQRLFELEQQRKNTQTIANDDDKKAAQQAYQQELNRLAREAATRALLLALYSPDQLREQMTWFWMNHFNVHQGKHNVRAMIGDYEDQAIRPHALGHFRDLLSATLRHPAMLIYLDNAQNARDRINENYARELMELHTLGVDGGYTQRDVQELARILTGVGVRLDDQRPKMPYRLQTQYVRQGLFEFNPQRHDDGNKVFLGRTIDGRGFAEVEEVLNRLSRHPATARFISRKLAVYFVADDPSESLVKQMTQTYLHTDGDIAAVLQTLFASNEFAQSLGKKFKDPIHYVLSAVRLAYDDKPILNAGPIINWLNRMGEPLYGHPTPDGYPMTEAAWTGSGQLATRFEIARAIGSGSAGLFRAEGEQAMARAAFPQLANALYFQSLQKNLSPTTRQALDRAASPQEWNTFFLASPEMMRR